MKTLIFLMQDCELPQDRLLNKQHIAAGLFYFLAYFKNVLSLFSKNSIHLCVIADHNLIFHLIRNKMTYKLQIQDFYIVSSDNADTVVVTSVKHNHLFYILILHITYICFRR